MGLVSKSLNELVNAEVNANGNISNIQIECAKNVLYAFDSEYPKSNYVIIKGQTQAGKTGVLYALANIINKQKLRETLKLKRIMYVTGDNSKDLVKQQMIRYENSFMNFNKDDIEIIFMKRSDFNKFQIEEKSIDGTIIFIDESHFGTSNKENLLPKFLKHYGIDYFKNTNLEEHNVRIISNTATPYCELASDKIQNKLTVLLEPSEGYVGLLDFADGVIPLEKNVFNKKNVDKALPKVIKDTYDHLKLIEISTGKTKCCIFRACGKNDINNLIKYGNDYFDIYTFDTSKGSALDYEKLWNKIDVYCGLNKNRSKNKFLMVVVKDALRMGISIRDKNDNNNTKNRIAVVYDYPSSNDKPEVTEQGLLGRLCGYRSENDNEWKDVRLYLNENHWNTLKLAYEKGLTDENGRLNQITLARKEKKKILLGDTTGLICACDIKKDFEELEKDDKIYYVDVPDRCDFYYEYDATDFFNNKIGQNFGGFEKFQLLDLKTPGKFTDNFIKPFLKSVDECYSSDVYVHKGSRRSGLGIAGNEEGFIKNLRDSESKLLLSSSAYPIKKDEIGKFAWQALLDLDKMEDPFSPKITIIVKISKIGAYKYINDIVDGKTMKSAPTMVTEN